MQDKPPKKGFVAGILGAISEAGKVFDTPSKRPPAATLGAPVDPRTDPSGERAERQRLKELLSSLPPEKQVAVRSFLAAMPLGAELIRGVKRIDRNIELSWVEVAMHVRMGGRNENQDRAYVNPISGVQVVCDGMDKKGAVAATTAVELIKSYFSVDHEGAILRATVNRPDGPTSKEDSLQKLGRVIHDEILKRLRTTGGEAGGTTMAGTVIEGNWLYSFHKGDSMNAVVREGRVVFCTRPMSRLQQAAERLNLPLSDIKYRVDDWVDSTSHEEFARIMPEIGGYTDKERIKSILHSDPGRVLGLAGDEADEVIVEQFKLLPGDTIVSMTDGASDALGIRVVPTKREFGRPQFNPDYDSISEFTYADDPLERLGGCAQRDAQSTMREILLLVDGNETGDNTTVVVSKFEPAKYVRPASPPPSIPEPPRLPPRRTSVPLPAPTAPPPDPAASGIFPPPRGIFERPLESRPPLVFDDRTESMPDVPEPPRPSTPINLPPPARVRIIPLPPTIPPPEPPRARILPPPLPPLEDSDPLEFIPIPGRRMPSEPPPLPPPLPPLEPRPSAEALRKAEDIRRLLESYKTIAHEYDEVFRSGDEVKADHVLRLMWDMQDRLIVLKALPKLESPRDPAVERRVRLNGYRYELDQANETWDTKDADYQIGIINKKWAEAYTALDARHDAGLHRREYSLLLAWEEGQFTDLVDEMVELRTRGTVEVLKIARILPPDHPRTPNMVIVQVLDTDGKPQKQVALTAEQWRQKLTKGTDLVVTRELYPIKADDLVREATASLEWIRLMFRGTRVAEKLDAGTFDANPELRTRYAALRNLLNQVVPSAGVQGFVVWVDQVERIHQQTERLIKGK